MAERGLVEGLVCMRHWGPHKAARSASRAGDVVIGSVVFPTLGAFLCYGGGPSLVMRSSIAAWQSRPRVARSRRRLFDPHCPGGTAALVLCLSACWGKGCLNKVWNRNASGYEISAQFVASTCECVRAAFAFGRETKAFGLPRRARLQPAGCRGGRAPAWPAAVLFFGGSLVVVVRG